MWKIQAQALQHTSAHKRFYRCAYNFPLRCSSRNCITAEVDALLRIFHFLSSHRNFAEIREEMAHFGYLLECQPFIFGSFIDLQTAGERVSE